MADRQPQNEGSDDSKTIKWVILILGGGVVFVFCAGVLAAIAVPSFMEYMKQSKAAEASAVMTQMRAGVTNYYQRHDRLPGLGQTVKSRPEPPTGGKKYSPKTSGLTADQKKLWQMFGWRGDPFYFQYTYEANETEGGAEAVIRARADFEKGGPVHTRTQTIKVKDGRLQVETAYVQNEFE